MKMRRVLLWLLMVIGAVLTSIPLALWSEGLGYRFDFETPGMIVAEHLVPADSARGLQVMSQRMNIQMPIDAAVWVIAILGVAVLAMRYGGKRRNDL